MAFDFTSASSHSLDSTSGGFDGTYPFTIFQWVYCADNTNNNEVSFSLTDKHASNDDRVSINPWSDGTLYLSARGLSGVDSFSVAYASATWLAVTARLVNATSRKLQVNGTSATDSTNVGAFPTFTHTVIGAKWNNTGTALSNFFEGRIAETAVWNVELTDQEVAALEAGFTPALIRPSALVLYKDLIRDENHPYIGVTLTNNNSVPVIEHPPMLVYPSSGRQRIFPAVAGSNAPTISDPGEIKTAKGHSEVIGTAITVADTDSDLSTIRYQCTEANADITVTLDGSATISAGTNGTHDLTVSGTHTELINTHATATYVSTIKGSDTGVTITATDASANQTARTITVTSYDMTVTASTQAILNTALATLLVNSTSDQTVTLDVIVEDDEGSTDTDSATITFLPEPIAVSPGVILLKNEEIIKMLDQEYNVLAPVDYYLFYIRDRKTGSISRTGDYGHSTS